MDVCDATVSTQGTSSVDDPELERLCIGGIIEIFEKDNTSKCSNVREFVEQFVKTLQSSSAKEADDLIQSLIDASSRSQVSTNAFPRNAEEPPRQSLEGSNEDHLAFLSHLDRLDRDYDLRSHGPFFDLRNRKFGADSIVSDNLFQKTVGRVEAQCNTISVAEAQSLRRTSVGGLSKGNADDSASVASDNLFQSSQADRNESQNQSDAVMSDNLDEQSEFASVASDNLFQKADGTVLLSQSDLSSVVSDNLFEDLNESRAHNEYSTHNKHGKLEREVVLLLKEVPLPKEEDKAADFKPPIRDHSSEIQSATRFLSVVKTFSADNSATFSPFQLEELRFVVSSNIRRLFLLVKEKLCLISAEQKQSPEWSPMIPSQELVQLEKRCQSLETDDSFFVDVMALLLTFHSTIIPVLEQIKENEGFAGVNHSCVTMTRTAMSPQLAKIVTSGFTVLLASPSLPKVYEGTELFMTYAHTFLSILSFLLIDDFLFACHEIFDLLHKDVSSVLVVERIQDGTSSVETTRRSLIACLKKAVHLNETVGYTLMLLKGVFCRKEPVLPNLGSTMSIPTQKQSYVYAQQVTEILENLLRLLPANFYQVCPAWYKDIVHIFRNWESFREKLDIV